MSMLRFIRYVGIFLLPLLSACSGIFKNKLDFNPSEPIRIAVLPFYQVDSKGALANHKDDLLIDQVGLVSSELRETPAELLRELVQEELKKSALDVVSPALVDSRLSHTGFVHEDLSFNLQKIAATSPQDFCPAVIDCDAVLIGKISKWDRSYYAIQSVASVSFSLSLISSRDGKVLFTASAEDAVSRGITKGPTGFSDLVLEPIRGLNSEIISDLARRMVRTSLQPLYMESRPEYLQSPLPAIYASAHDSNTGIVRAPVTVVMLGTPGMNGTFSIGDAITHHPMAERDGGHYVGEYFPLPTDSFKDAVVTVYLTDKFGRSTEQILGQQKLSLQTGLQLPLIARN